MTKGPSESIFREAVKEAQLATVLYKPSDDARNWKPCDYMIWTPAPSWWEVKESKAVGTFPRAAIRPSQSLGISDAEYVGLPYWLAVYWQRGSLWTISDAVKVMGWFGETNARSISRDLLRTRFGVETARQHLPSVIKAALLGEL